MDKKRSASKMLRIAPTVSDPKMQSNRQVLDDMDDLDETNSMADVIFDRKRQTKEEQDSRRSEGMLDNTMLMVIFALIVVGLVAIIVWLVTKQDGSKEEDEIRRAIHPHQRNNMPPHINYQQHYQQHPQHYQQHPQQHPQQPQQPRVNKKQPPVEEDSDDSDEETPQVIQKPKKPKKTKVEAKETKEVKVAQGFTKDNPSPDILRPGVPPAEQPANKTSSAQEIEDILKKTAEYKPEKITEADKELIESVKAEESDTDDDSDDE